MDKINIETIKEKLAELDFAKITINVKQLIGAINELSLAQSIIDWQKDPDTYQNELTIAISKTN